MTGHRNDAAGGCRLKPGKIIAAFVLALTAAAWLSSARAQNANAKNADEKGATINGVELFANTCGFCHHKGGRKAGRGPKLAGSSRSDEFLFNRIRKGKKGRMPAFRRAFSDEQIHAIVAYIRSLDETD